VRGGETVGYKFSGPSHHRSGHTWITLYRGVPSFSVFQWLSIRKSHERHLMLFLPQGYQSVSDVHVGDVQMFPTGVGTAMWTPL